MLYAEFLHVDLDGKGMLFFYINAKLDCTLSKTFYKIVHLCAFLVKQLREQCKKKEKAFSIHTRKS